MDGVQFFKMLGSKWKYGRRINVAETASISQSMVIEHLTKKYMKHKFYNIYYSAFNSESKDYF